MRLIVIVVIVVVAVLLMLILSLFVTLLCFLVRESEQVLHCCFDELAIVGVQKLPQISRRSFAKLFDRFFQLGSELAVAENVLKCLAMARKDIFFTATWTGVKHELAIFVAVASDFRQNVSDRVQIRCFFCPRQEVQIATDRCCVEEVASFLLLVFLVEPLLLFFVKVVSRLRDPKATRIVKT